MRGGWIKLQNEELHNEYSSLNSIIVIEKGGRYGAVR
jgi:hypothetical protein